MAKHSPRTTNNRTDPLPEKASNNWKRYIPPYNKRHHEFVFTDLLPKPNSSVTRYIEEGAFDTLKRLQKVNQDRNQ